MLRHISEKQRAASRRNGARSRGPKTADGKARSALNAFKHGHYAKLTCVTRGEDSGAFRAYLASAVRRFAPVDDLENHLVESIAAIDWRLTRLAAIETNAFDIEVRNHLPGLVAGGARVTELDRTTLGALSLVDRSRLPRYILDAESRLVTQRASLMRQLVVLQEKFRTSQDTLPLLDSTPLDPDLSPGNKPGLNLQPVDSMPPAPGFVPLESPENTRN